MTLEKLNSVAAQYYASPTQDLFRELYAEATAAFRKVNRSQVVGSRKGDENDADEIFDSVVLTLSREVDVRDFGRALSARLKNARLTFFRNESRRRKRYELTLDSGTPDAPTFDPAAELTTEDIVLQRNKKKEADQRQLIDFLVRSVKTDATTTSIVEAYRFAPLSAKPTEIAKSLGIHHETAKRKLHGLARRYDANRFGDIHEYLAV